MLTPRRSAERGHANHGWLDSRHSFSFADYYDPAHMGFRALRVINEDRVRGGAGFPPHSHRDMEIISYVLEGGLLHKDSLGTGSLIRPGDVQRMSAGRGVTHSEFNASPSQLVHFLQIWIVPGQRGLAPSYAQKSFSAQERRGRLCLVASADGRDGSVMVNADVALYAGSFEAEERAEHALTPGRHVWVQVARGRMRVNDVELSEGDGAAVSDELGVELRGVESAELLLFDLA
jgi:redox-sensitive bicupin YhaK (pirin superfamily)